MGDVALTIPVIRAASAANPDLSFTIVTRPFFAPFFEGIPNLYLFFPDLQKRHKGFKGLFRLFLDLHALKKWEAVLDLHSVLRTHIVSNFFFLSGRKVYRIDKGRKEKKRLIKTKQIATLKHSTQRYADVFFKAGIPLNDFFPKNIIPSTKTLEAANKFLASSNSGTGVKIGIAPFAKHDPKIWGVENFTKLIQLISTKYTADFFLFGGGKEEIEKLSELSQSGTNIHMVAGKLKFDEEIALISILDFMISMDSSNMHIAALTGIPTISIWGGTHPAFGFSAFGQPQEYSLQVPNNFLSCRPCSVFGNIPCIQNEKLCMKAISPDLVLTQLEKFKLFKNSTHSLNISE